MSLFKSIGHALGKVSHAATSVVSHSVNFTGGLVGHIPLVGKVKKRKEKKKKT